MSEEKKREILEKIEIIKEEADILFADDEEEDEESLDIENEE